MRWNDWTNPVDQDYDLILLRWNGSSWVQIASSTDFQNGGAGQRPREQALAITSGSDAPYGFIIQRFSSTQAVNFEIFAPKVARLDELLNARSLSNLADAPNALTVAALDIDSPYPQESYSSEGPTNGSGGAATGGSIKPDISAFANVSSQSYGVGGFNGTSAATPHVAGAAALVAGANPAYTPAQLRTFLEGRAIDLGSAGKDTKFGYGRLYLGLSPVVAPSTFYVYLPFIIKAPTTPPLSGATPGFWSSNTGDEFYVTATGANVDNFAIYLSVPPCGTYKITHLLPEPITNNHFSFSGSFYASGTFNSTTTASGTDGLINFNLAGCGIVNGGPWAWNATWKNSSQPALMTATVVGPESVEPITGATSSYTVTLLK